ncbi:MAG: hypothetical protein ACLQUY_03815 [Ktedonobacterales bacterium]
MNEDTHDHERSTAELPPAPKGTSQPYSGMRSSEGRDVDEYPGSGQSAWSTAEDGLGEAYGEREEIPLARVRYGLGKELRLYPDAFTVLLREENEELRYTLANIKRLLLTPGEHNPSKLVLMVELDDGNTVIAAEGVSNVAGFRKLLRRLEELNLPIELDPPDMDEQLRQALEIRSRYQIGCYGLFLGICLLLAVTYVIVALIGATHH